MLSPQDLEHSVLLANTSGTTYPELRCPQDLELAIHNAKNWLSYQDSNRPQDLELTVLNAKASCRMKTPDAHRILNSQFTTRKASCRIKTQSRPQDLELPIQDASSEVPCKDALRPEAANLSWRFEPLQSAFVFFTCRQLFSSRDGLSHLVQKWVRSWF